MDVRKSSRLADKVENKVKQSEKKKNCPAAKSKDLENKNNQQSTMRTAVRNKKKNNTNNNNINKINYNNIRGINQPMIHSIESLSAKSPALISYPVHPDVRFKSLPFYLELSELIKPMSLMTSFTTINTQIQNRLHFYLTPQQADDMANSRDSNSENGKMRFNVQVQIRFCLQESSHEQEDCIPMGVMVKVNEKYCPIPVAKPTPGAKAPKSQPHKPLDISAHVKISPIVENKILIICPNDMFGNTYAVGVYLVRKLTSYEVLNQMKAKGVRHPDCTRGLIKEKLNEDADSEIATTSLRVSLACPLGKMRMSTPCRSSTCTHLQCFDAGIYLQMNELKPTWICPVCNKSAKYDSLIIDGYFLSILLSNELLPDVNEIQLLPDGSWRNLVPKKDQEDNDRKCGPVSQQKINSKVDKAADDFVDKTKVGLEENKIDFVDLISSDEDDAENKEEISNLAANCKRKLNSEENNWSSGNSNSKIIIIDLD
ncbi:E3 SUMO-protein ligase PIAS2 [Microplitis demolitor]|uniref:E3 SUMO-protein ligase PIAS2 n=1 Tax=Microplitis demolitor TaxID=69319 RepID=UPI0004CD1556|nr:E3 SUMO-protein ligase PIAS2 [Microplitis demolitor]